jgi:hypothetical protein
MDDLNSTLGQARSRRGFLKAGLAVAGAATAAGLTFGTAFAEDEGPDDGHSGGDSTLDIFNGALTAEQLAVTFYYNALHASPVNFPSVLSADHIHYFEAGLWEEHRHAQLFAAVGAQSLAGPSPKFFFPAGTFANEATFLAVLAALEDAFVAAYLAAIGEWSRGGSRARRTVPDGFTPAQLAKIAGQIMGVEAEHRTLGRDVGNAAVPNNRIFEKALFERIGTPSDATGTAVGALLPFVTGNGFPPTSYPLPSAGNVMTTATTSTINQLENDWPGGLAKP